MTCPQFSIRTLLWLTLVVAVIAIWAWLESGAELQVIDGRQSAAIPSPIARMASGIAIVIAAVLAIFGFAAAFRRIR